MVPIGSVNEKTAVLTEPFAAALQAVIASPPAEGSSVAVLGPRRLGSLIIAALVGYRNQSKRNFKITALARRDSILELTRELGADSGINLTKTPKEDLLQSFDIVYDTTAHPEGFELAMELSKKEVHLKSTNGQVVCGVKKMTELVVDELSLVPYSEANLNFHWEIDSWNNEKIWVSPNLASKLNLGNKKTYSTKIEDLKTLWESKDFKDRLPRFDLAIVESIEEIDIALRPFSDSEESMVRPRGAILVLPNSTNNKLLQFIARGGEVHSSRCGDFHLALKVLEQNPILSEKLHSKMITHEMDISDLPAAFSTARNSSSIKVIVRHS